MSATYPEINEANSVRLTDVIGSAFYDCHWDIQDGLHTYYDLYGGRGSLKSTFAGVEIVFGMLQDPAANAVIFRKVADTLRDSVYGQVQWAIEALGVSDYWHASISPMRFVYKPTGQMIIFRGLDKAQKTKSIKCPKGYFKYLWFEELDEFAGEKEIRTVEQSVMRGGPKFVVFKTFNPPLSRTNWANVYVATANSRAYRLKTDYTQSPREWLGDEFIEKAEHLKATNEKAYRHEYMGEPVGIGADIFEMLDLRAITDEEISRMERIYQGQDWGWFPDPKAFVRLAYDHNTEKIYALDEIGGCKIRVKTMAQKIKAAGYDDYEVICGADEIESVADFTDAGLYARRANVGPGSVRYTMEWLQCRTLVIDQARTPNLYKEVTEYEHELDKNGNIIDGYPDKNNHYIDAMRYATSPMSLRRGESA